MKKINIMTEKGALKEDEKVDNVSESSESDDVSVKESAERYHSDTESDPVQVVEHRHSLDIPFRTVLLFVAIVAAIIVGSQILQALVVMFFGFVFSATLLPVVKRMVKAGIPHGLSIFMVYSVLAAAILGLFVLVFSPFLSELSDLNAKLPAYSESITDAVATVGDYLGLVDKSDEEVTDRIQEFVERQFSLEFFAQVSGDRARATIDTLSSVSGFFGGLVLAIILSIYIVYDHDTFIDILMLQIVDKKRRKLVKKLIHDLEDKLGAWLRGQGAVSSIVGILVWVVLFATDVPFALPLAVLAGIMVAVPALGAFIAGVPIVIIAALSQGFVVGLIVLIAFFVIQQLENSVLVPKIMGSVVGVKPIIVFVGILVGFTLAGVIGAVLTVPVLVIGKIGYDFYLTYQKMRAEEHF